MALLRRRAILENKYGSTVDGQPSNAVPRRGLACNRGQGNLDRRLLLLFRSQTARPMPVVLVGWGKEMASVFEHVLGRLADMPLDQVLGACRLPADHGIHDHPVLHILCAPLRPELRR